MGKRFFYECSGRVFLESNNQAEAEKAVTGIPLDDYLIDEDLYQIDESYVAYDLKKREKQFGTDLHPVNDSDEYQEFKMRVCRYGNIFKEFLHGKFDKNELMKRMAGGSKTSSHHWTHSVASGLCRRYLYPSHRHVPDVNRPICF